MNARTLLCRRAITAVVFTLTLVVSFQAWAACAWVLWEESDSLFVGDIPMNLRTSWTVHVARQTQAECEDVLGRIWRLKVESWQPGPDRPGIKEVKSAPGYVAVTFQTKDGEYRGSSRHSFRCLPDTIDPRGTKQ